MAGLGVNVVRLSDGYSFVGGMRNRESTVSLRSGNTL